MAGAAAWLNPSQLQTDVSNMGSKQTQQNSKNSSVEIVVRLLLPAAGLRGVSLKTNGKPCVSDTEMDFDFLITNSQSSAFAELFVLAEANNR